MWRSGENRRRRISEKTGAPAYTAVGASIGLLTSGIAGLLLTRARPPARFLRRGGFLALASTPFAAAALALLLQIACPLYVYGKHSGFCNYQEEDLLGGWLSGVIVAFAFDAIVVATLLFISAAQARD
jgi:hypothetical protein